MEVRREFGWSMFRQPGVAICIVTLLCGFILTASIVDNAEVQRQTEISHNFSRFVERDHRNIKDRIESFRSLLDACQSLKSTGRAVHEEEWDKLVQLLSTRGSTGPVGVGYAQLDRKGRDPSNWTAVISLASPAQTQEGLIGADLAQNSLIRSEMMRDLHSKDGFRIDDIFDIRPQIVGANSLFFVPSFSIGKNGRQVDGWVFAAIDFKAALADIIADSGPIRANILSSDSLSTWIRLGPKDDTPDGASMMVERRMMSTLGQHFTIIYSALESDCGPGQEGVYKLLLLGIVITLLVTWTLFNLLNSRVMAVAFAQKMTYDLRMKEQEARTHAQQAEEVSRIKSQFIANISHEVRTPMNAVVGMASLLAETQLNPTQREFCRTIVDSAESLLNIINDILDFSKMEASKLELENEPFVLREVIESTSESIGTLAYRKGLDLTVDISPDMPQKVLGDGYRFRQVILNLLSNAVKFTEHGDITVRAEVRKTGEDQVLMVLNVADTGIGIPLDRQSTVFESFTQADGSTTRKYGGTGLGLTICSEIVNLMGGNIRLRSKPGQGCEFTVRVPFKVVEQGTIEHDFEGMRVVYAARSDRVRAALGRMLSSVGCIAVEMPADYELAAGDFVIAEPGFISEDWPEARLIHLLNPSEAIQKSAGINVIKPVRFADILAALHEVRGDTQRDGTTSPFAIERFDLRVLVVDDNAVNRKVACKMLERLGCEVQLAADGYEAIEVARVCPFDLILMDLHMPGLSGGDAAKAIREFEDSLGRRNRIFALTADVMADARQASAEAGMDGFLTKPTRIEDMRRVLREIALEERTEAA